MPKILTESETKKTQINIQPNDILLQKACDFIAPLEGCQLKAYQDSVNVWTIGYGHTSGVKEGQIITREKANQLLNDDTKDFLSFVCGQVGKICNENQIIALTSFTFNLGKSDLKKSTLLKVIKENPRNFIAIRNEFMRWIYADGKILNGLKNRRSAEADLYEKA